MNRIDFTILAGFPGSQDTLEFLQSTYSDSIAGLSLQIGDMVIVSGMKEVGNQVSDGWVIIDNELLPFKGGSKGPYVIIEEVAEEVQFKDNSVHPVYFTRRVRFGTGNIQYAYSSLVRLDTALKVQQDLSDLKEQVDNLTGFVPKGLISMWSGSIGDIPADWALCDGTNETPDLRGRFIVGYDPNDFDYNSIGRTGGEKKHKLSVNEMPSHSFKLTAPNTDPGAPNANGEHLYRYSRNGSNSNNYELMGGSQTPSRFSTNSIGNDEAHENRPPYYSLAYIMKL